MLKTSCIEVTPSCKSVILIQWLGALPAVNIIIEHVNICGYDIFTANFICQQNLNEQHITKLDTRYFLKFFVNL